MTQLIIAVLGVGIGFVLGLLAALVRAQSLGQDKARLEEKVGRLEPLQDEVERLQRENGDLRTEAAALAKDREAQEEKLAWLDKAREELKTTFEALSSRALQSNAEEYLKRTREQLDHTQKMLKGDWGKQQQQMSGLVEPLKENLKALDQQVRQMEEKREGAYKALDTQLVQLRSAYSELRDTTTGLTTALTKSSSARGTWGEMELRRIVELAGLVSHVDFEQQESRDQGRPDMQIHLPNGGILPVDAKTTLASFRAVTEAETDADRRVQVRQHAQAVRGRVRELGSKAYWRSFERSPEFVVMFLPHDGILGAAFEGDKDLLDDAFRQRVLLATPITLLALLKTVAYGWQQQAIAENAQKIALQGKELYERVNVFISHFRGVGEGLNKAVAQYNKSVSSFESRLLPAARRFKELGVSGSDLPDMQGLDQQAGLPSEGEA